MIKSIALKNVSQAYSVANQLIYNIDNSTQKHLLYKQFVAWNCNGCSTESITGYINNPICQELPIKKKHFSQVDDSIYINLRDSRGYADKIEKLRQNDSDLVLKVEFKNMLIRKIRLRALGNYQGEYLFVLGLSE